MTVVINLFGGPGTGKSTLASELFALMKWKEYNVELIDEYAKELSWSKRTEDLGDQLYVVAKQQHKMARLRDKVDCIITDSPLVMALPYCKPDYYPETFPKLVWDVFDSYTNVNIFLKRHKPFHGVGRHHTEEESKYMDGVIKLMLYDAGVIFTEVDAVKGASEKIHKIFRHKIFGELL